MILKVWFCKNVWNSDEQKRYLDFKILCQIISYIIKKLEIFRRLKSTKFSKNFFFDSCLKFIFYSQSQHMISTLSLIHFFCKKRNKISSSKKSINFIPNHSKKNYWWKIFFGLDICKFEFLPWEFFRVILYIKRLWLFKKRIDNWPQLWPIKKVSWITVFQFFPKTLWSFYS